jgi:transcriptional regulator GlxA family with amidase domain
MLARTAAPHDDSTLYPNGVVIARSPYLKTLAGESGYSRNHFLRMFRAATGYSPHQYLLHLRVKRAQEMMMKN